MNIYEQLAKVQQALKAPKDQRNNFGNYNYRSCEGILEAVKPLLAKNELALTLSDEMVEVGSRVYVKATATVYKTGANVPVEIDRVSVSAYAREEEVKKGMDSSQITGAASSYARKYALNGLFCIDDNRDSDATNTHGKDDTPNKNEAKAERLIKKDGDVSFAVCEECGNNIYDWKRKDGYVMPVKEFVLNSMNLYGKALCKDCIKKRTT